MAVIISVKRLEGCTRGFWNIRRTGTNHADFTRQRKVTSAILQHLLDSGHHVDLREAFSVVYRVPPMRYKSSRRKILSIADPSLCRQKHLFAALVLLWPISNVNANLPVNDTGELH